MLSYLFIVSIVHLTLFSLCIFIYETGINIFKVFDRFN